MHNPSDECPTRFSQVKREYEHAERGVFWKGLDEIFFRNLVIFCAPLPLVFRKIGTEMRQRVCCVHLARCTIPLRGTHTPPGFSYTKGTLVFHPHELARFLSCRLASGGRGFLFGDGCRDVCVVQEQVNMIFGFCTVL